MSYECEVIEMDAQPAVAVRELTTYHKLPSTIGHAFSSLRRYLNEHELIQAGPMYVRYSGPPAHELTVEVGVPVPKHAPTASGFTTSSLPGCRVATCIHRGHYSDLPHAYRALEKWVSKEGLATTGEAYELYLNDGEHTPPPAWLTRVAMPLA